jgi:hypothetical protein
VTIEGIIFVWVMGVLILIALSIAAACFLAIR